MSDKQVAYRVIETLKEIGVKHIFGVPSGGWVDYLEAIRNTEGIDFILTTHEGGAGFMAAVCGRITGVPGRGTRTAPVDRLGQRAPIRPSKELRSWHGSQEEREEDHGQEGRSEEEDRGQADGGFEIGRGGGEAGGQGLLAPLRKRPST